MEQKNNVEQPENLNDAKKISELNGCDAPTYSEIKKSDLVDEITATRAVDALNGVVADDMGSTGKFKSQSELLKAYKNLEAEFTRKSQKLKELEKALSEKKEGEAVVKDAKEPSGEISKSADELEKPVDETPIYFKENWEDVVGEFLRVNPNAQSFASEICELILSDKQVANAVSPLETAWQIIASKNCVDKKSIISDDDFIENYVLNNKEFLDKVMSKYIKENVNSAAPVLINGGCASEFSVAKKSKPLSFEDAKAEIEKLF